MDLSREQSAELNKKEYGEDYSLLRWVTDEEALKADEERKRILSSLAGSVQLGFHETKLDCRKLSPGCVLCGEGLWSCLFVNSLCNARCFYCPTEQTSRSEPITNGIVFSNPQDYTDYLEKFRIKGASLSGGEPFLTFDRTLLFLRKIKGRYGSEVYLWLYTNGIAASRENLEALNAAGLDEIRFDLSASRYDLRRVSLAAGILHTVTVEIPAIPEDFERLKSLVSELRDMGIR
ncbi:MAG: radical SAM protein, partial [Deltaproteobacteria bacterium]|nr:radical SAM protein [Deltaproteobacteria bacterium]